MPLEQRVISPIWVSRGCFEFNQHHSHHSQGANQQINVKNELECVTNGTLSNIIRQLSSLSRHAEDLFGSLLQETTGLVQRSVNLKQRLDILTDKVEHLSDACPDQPVTTISKKPYRSRADNFDQQIVARTTMPVSLREVYERCDPPPTLSKLNPFRDDDIDGLKLYTNPNYFFELWRKEMLAGKSKASKKDAHASSSKKSKSRNTSSRHQSVDSNMPIQHNVHYHVQQQQHPAHSQIIMNQGPNSRTSLASGDMPYGIYGETNGLIVQPAYAQQQKVFGQIPGGQQQQQQQQQQQLSSHNQLIYGYQGQVIPGSYDQTGTYGEQNYNQQQYGQQNRPNSLELSQQQQQYYQQMEYYKQQQQQQCGVYGTGQQSVYGQNNQYQGQQQSPNQVGTPTKRANAVNRPSVAPPAPPPGAPGSQPSTPVKGRMLNGNGDGISSRDSLLPPPPPPPSMMMDEMPPPPPPPSIQMSVSHGNAPPPPPMPPSDAGSFGFAPPPPPPPPPPVSVNSTSSISMDVPSKKPAVSGNLAKPTAEMLQAVKLKKTEPKTNNGCEDNRSNLLAAIRQGITLKRVEETRKEVEKTAPLHDVASILARRVAMEMSDSEGEGKNEDDEESDCWDDDSEC